MLSLAKATLRFCRDNIPEFHNQMESLFSIFRGDTKRRISYSGLQAYIQLDSNVNDGFIHETDEEIVIELGMNFSDASVDEKSLILRDGRGDQVNDIIDGEAALIHISKHSDRITVVTDHFGLFPIYFYQDDGYLILSTDLMGVLATRPDLRTELDEQSVVEFVSCHFILENRTLFKDVLRLDEGTITVFQPANQGKEQEEWLKIPTHHEERDLKSWIRIVSEKFQNSLRKRLTRTSGMFLSGGMDSRVILAAIPKEIRQEMQAISFGVEGADDTRIALKVAKRFGINLVHLVLDIPIFRDNFMKHVWMSAGISNHMVAPIAAAVAMLDIDRIFDGFAGDAQFGGGFHDQTLILDKGKWPENPKSYLMTKVIEKGYIRPLNEAERVFSKYNRDDIIDIVEKGIEGELKRFSGETAPTIIFEMILFRMRVRGNTIGAQISADSVCPVMKPYYDWDFADTIMRIPANIRRYHVFYNRFIENVLPDALKNETTTILPFDEKAKMIRRVKRVLRFLARKVGVTLFPKRGWIPIDDWIRHNEEYRNWIIDILLSERTENRGIIDSKGIRNLLHDEIVNQKNFAMTLVNTVDLELILRLYSDGDGFKMFGNLE